MNYKMLQANVELKEITVGHILHDDKFIDLFVNKYCNENISNIFLYVKNDFTYQGKYKSHLHHIVPFSPEFFTIYSLLQDVDILFLYNLDYEKAYLINNILRDKRISIVWNFFGSELYSNTKYPFFKCLYGKQTEKLLSKRFQAGIIGILRILKYKLKRRLVPELEVKKAIENVDFFAWYSIDEYNYLKSKAKHLPPFLLYPLERFALFFPEIKKNNKRLLLGNSAAPENNHFEILSILNQVGYPGTAVVPFSYGSDRRYINTLPKKSKALNIDIEYLTGFMPFEEYSRKINECSIAIFNSYRQMALGNIFIALANGIKVYLSERNPSFPWLKNVGFKVFSIETDLRTDLIEDDLQLTLEYSKHNCETYLKLTDNKNIESYLSTISNIVGQRKAIY